MEVLMHDMDRRDFLARGSLIGAGAAAALVPAAALARPDSRDFGAIDAALEQAVKNGTVLGVAAMAATPDGIVYNGRAGKANIETGAPMHGAAATGGTLQFLTSRTLSEQRLLHFCYCHRMTLGHH
jgi:hypothetical protein